MPRLDSEMVAIRWHMGAWKLNQDDNEEKQNYKAATDRLPLVTILQTADTLAARIIGSLLGIALTKDVISMRISL